MTLARRLHTALDRSVLVGGGARCFRGLAVESRAAVGVRVPAACAHVFSVLPRVSLGVERLVAWRGAVLEAPGRWPAAALLCVPAAACAGSGFFPTSRHAVVFLMTAVFVAVKRRLAVHYRLEP